MKKIIIGVVVVVFILGAGIFFLTKQKPANDEPVAILPTQQPEEGKVLEFSPENPLVVLYPRSDGRAVFLEVTKLTGINTVSYEMIYQTKTQQEGTLGTPITIKPSETSIRRELLFGTCSKNVCRYHEGVESGSISIKFGKTGKPSDEWRADFKLETTAAGKKLTSMDENFILEMSGAPKSLYVITAPVSSLPAPIEGKTVAGQPYGVFPASSLIMKNMMVSIKVKNPDPSMKIYGWNEDKLEWINYGGEVDSDKQLITAKVDRLTIFAVAK